MSTELCRIMTGRGGWGEPKNSATCFSATSLFVTYLTFLSIIQIIAPSVWIVMNWNGCRRMWSLHNLKYNLGIDIE